MGNDRVKHSHLIPILYLKNFAYKDLKHPQNTKSVLIAKKENFNLWKQKGFGQNSIFTLNGIYDFDVIPEQIQTVEKYLNVIETGMGRVVSNLRNHKKLSDENYIYLSLFIVSLMNRTPKNMKQFQETIKKIHDIFEQFDSTENNEYTKEYFQGFEDASKIRILQSLDIVNSSQFINENFYFLYNFSNLPFIASDNPVVIEDFSKNIIEGILTFPVHSKKIINRKSIILPITPNICVLYCEYLDKKIIDNQFISIYDEEIIFKLNMLQLRNCENFIISNIDNSQIDYAQCYEHWCNKDNSQKLLFSTEQNTYLLKAEFIEHDVFSSKIKINDITDFCSIYSKEVFTSVMTCNKTPDCIKVKDMKIIETQNDYLIVETSILNNKYTN